MSDIYVEESNQSNLDLEQIVEAMGDTMLPLYGLSEGHSYAPEEEPERYRFCRKIEAGIIKLGVHHLQVVLNDVDDYRSNCSDIRDLVSLKNYSGLEFFKHPVALVRVVPFDTAESPENNDEECEYYYGQTQGWKFIDADGHVWLEVGTSNYDDYYPCFFLRWHAKPPSKAA